MKGRRDLEETSYLGPLLNASFVVEVSGPRTGGLARGGTCEQHTEMRRKTNRKRFETGTLTARWEGMGEVFVTHLCKPIEKKVGKRPRIFAL